MYKFIILCLILTSGCQLPSYLITNEKYTEESAWDKEKGGVKNFEKTWTYEPDRPWEHLPEDQACR